MTKRVTSSMVVEPDMPPTTGHCEWCGASEATERVIGTRACSVCAVDRSTRVRAALARWKAGRG